MILNKWLVIIYLLYKKPYAQALMKRKKRNSSKTHINWKKKILKSNSYKVKKKFQSQTHIKWKKIKSYFKEMSFTYETVREIIPYYRAFIAKMLYIHNIHLWENYYARFASNSL